jgi:ribosomal protein S18 acetylase RimI-like enzyme
MRYNIPAQAEDLDGIARVFIKAFPDSVRHYVGRNINPALPADLFRIAFDAEPLALIVAVVDSEVAGYILAPSKFSHLFSAAVMHRDVYETFWRWITGRYGIGVRPVVIAARNWFYLWRESREGRVQVEARILSVAVDPDFQGCGIGTRLVQLGLEYLKSVGSDKVRLEVRPANIPAKHVYEKLGFEPVGHTRDTQGEWLIMVKDMSGDVQG